MKIINNEDQHKIIHELRLLKIFLEEKKRALVASLEGFETYNERCMLNSYNRRITDIDALIRSLI